MSLTIWVFTALVTLFAGAVTAITGFGIQLVAPPLLLLFLDGNTTVFYSALFAAEIGAPILWQTREFIKPLKVALLGIGNILGLPVGILFISRIDASLLKVLIGVLVVVFAVLLALGRTRPMQRENIGCLIFGFLGGILMTGTGLGGPVVVLFLLNQHYSAQSFRANMAAFLVIGGVTSVISLMISDLVTMNTFVWSLSFLPVIVVSYFIGRKIQPLLNPRVFRIAAIGIVLVSGLAATVLALLSQRS